MRFWWIAVVVVVIDCGGSSLRREAAGDGDDSGDGGTSGSAGARGGTAGTSTGGATNPTGGRGGGGGTTAGGGRVSGGGSGGSIGGDGGNGAVSGAAGSDGGGAGEPICDEDLFLSTCSPEDTCELLECGAPWSFFDARRCRRTECTETGTCPVGERCVPAPVLGKYDDPCSYGWDSCDHDVDGNCGCSYWEECMPLALCVPEDEFPPSRDCPLDDPMDCVALARATSTLEAYRDGTEFMFFPYEPPEALAASVESCATRLADALQAECD